MPKIEDITCRRIVNSRAEWTIETKVFLDDGSIGVQAVPNGASQGENEAVDIDSEKAVDVVNNTISQTLIGKDPFNQKLIDETLVKMDGTHNKGRLGGNSILSVSLAVSKACANSQNIELYSYLSLLYSGKEKNNADLKFPTPIFNIFNGGKHAENDLSFQEFMIIPALNTPYNKAVEIGVNVYQDLKDLLLEEEYEVGIGNEGGFAPRGFSADLALEAIRSAANKRYDSGCDLFFGMDVAAGSFYSNDRYVIKEEHLEYSSDEMMNFYKRLFEKYEIIYCEDPIYEGDTQGWKNFYKLFSNKLMVVADDLVVTNPELLLKAIEGRMANSVIVKPNQIGTLTETLEFVKIAKKAKMNIIVSHRSGENPSDTFISDLSVAVDADFIKSGAPAGGERVAKYNRLLEIFDQTV